MFSQSGGREKRTYRARLLLARDAGHGYAAFASAGMWSRARSQPAHLSSGECVALSRNPSSCTVRVIPQSTTDTTGAHKLLCELRVVSCTNSEVITITNLLVT